CQANWTRLARSSSRCSRTETHCRCGRARQPKAELIGALRQRAKGLKRIDVRSNEVKRIGLDRLGSMLNVLCLKLMAVHDEDALRRNSPRFEKRDLPHWRSATARHRPRD